MYNKEKLLGPLNYFGPCMVPLTILNYLYIAL